MSGVRAPHRALIKALVINIFWICKSDQIGPKARLGHIIGPHLADRLTARRTAQAAWHAGLWSKDAGSAHVEFTPRTVAVPVGVLTGAVRSAAVRSGCTR